MRTPDVVAPPASRPPLAFGRVGRDTVTAGRSVSAFVRAVSDLAAAAASLTGPERIVEVWMQLGPFRVRVRTLRAWPRGLVEVRGRRLDDGRDLAFVWPITDVEAWAIAVDGGVGGYRLRVLPPAPGCRDS
jgi:hypothetical protein